MRNKGIMYKHPLLPPLIKSALDSQWVDIIERLKVSGPVVPCPHGLLQLLHIVHLLVFWQLHLKCSLLPQPVALLKELKELVCPGAYGADVEPYESWLLRCRANREGVPLVLGYGGDLNEYIVAWLVSEV